MNNFLYILFSIYFILGIGICIGYILQKNKENKIFNLTKNNIDIKELVVIIPFRNEEQRISNLIECINNLEILPKKILFINDHSSDNSIAKINLLNKNISFEIINLPRELKGKKAAIQFGVLHEKCEYNLTWDADIEVDLNYFNFIKTLPTNDLYVLPVIMKGCNFKEKYFESDFTIANAINASVNGWRRPFLASGANLLFKQKTYIETSKNSSHAHISSGDDIFLLRDFRLNNKSIELITDKKLAVSTKSPETFQEFLQQRLRWIGKSGKVKDSLSNSLAIISLTFNLMFLILFIILLFKSEYLIFIICFSLKTTIDMLTYLTYHIKINRINTWVLLPLFSIIQPIYLVTLLIMLGNKKAIWKEREIVIK